MAASKGSGLFGTRNARKPHLGSAAEHAGALGEISALRSDIKAEMSSVAGFVVEEFTNPPAADVDAIKLGFATAVTAQVFTGAALDGVVGIAAMVPPRNVTVTADANVGGYLGSATIKGSFRGVPQTEAIVITDSATTAGVKPFDQVTEIDIPIQPDALGVLSVGFGELIGLAKNPKTRAGLTEALKEIVDGAVVTTGVLDATNGTYDPAASPNAAHDYAVVYEGSF